MTAPNRRWPRFLLWTLLLVACMFLVAFVWDWNAQSAEFDGELWRDETMIPKGVRLAMADGLVARDSLRGKSRSEVVAMLGEPPPPEYFREWDMVYRLGMERGLFGIDSEWLVLRLGMDARVVEYRIVTD